MKEEQKVALVKLSHDIGLVLEGTVDDGSIMRQELDAARKKINEILGVERLLIMFPID